VLDNADGLPIGLQIVGHRFDDLGVLRMARAYENFGRRRGHDRRREGVMGLLRLKRGEGQEGADNPVWCVRLFCIEKPLT
jgi:hypothetical protein